MPHQIPKEPQYEESLKARPPVPPPRPGLDPMYDSVKGRTTMEARRAAFQANDAPPDYIDVISDNKI